MQKKTRITSIGIIVAFLVFFGFFISDSYAHPGYNSEEQVIGRYRVTTSTVPEIPSPGEITTIIFTIYDLDYNTIENFRAGIRIFYNDEQVDTIPMKYINQGHWDLDYVFEKSGNHVFRVDVEDAGTDGRTITYTFNVSTLNPFGYLLTQSMKTCRKLVGTEELQYIVARTQKICVTSFHRITMLTSLKNCKCQIDRTGFSKFNKIDEL